MRAQDFGGRQVETFVSPGSGVKTCFSELEWLERIEPEEDVIGQGLKHGRLAQAQNGAILRTGELAGQEEKFVAQLGKGEALPGFWQAQALECRNQIVGQANDFQEQRVGLKRAGGYFAQRIILQQLADARGSMAARAS